MATKTEKSEVKNYLWTSAELSEALGTKVPDGLKIESVSIDSRTLKKNSLFVAIRGENLNGNDFAADAIKKGAAFSIVDEVNPTSKKFQSQLLIVDNTLDALNRLAKYARARVRGKVIGVTGSVGKTSTKEMLKVALENQGNIYATEGNFNNHFGLPLCLANMPADTDYGVLEMGMSSAGELSHLSLLSRPDVAIVTTVAPAHLEFFTSVSAIAAAKSEIFDGVPSDGVAIVNADNAYTPILIERANKLKLKVVTFGENNKADFKLLSYTLKKGQSHLVTECNGKDIEYYISSLGKHLALNSTAVLAAAKESGAELQYAARNLRDFKAHKGRGEVHEVANLNITVIDDSYNANPASMRAAMELLREYRTQGRRVVAVLGNMLELGVKAGELHELLSEDIIKNEVDVVYTVGDLMLNLFDKLPVPRRGGHAANSNDMANIIKKQIKPGDVILIKGSNAMKMNAIVNSLIGNA